MAPATGSRKSSARATEATNEDALPGDGSRGGVGGNVSLTGRMLTIDDWSPIIWNVPPPEATELTEATRRLHALGGSGDRRGESGLVERRVDRARLGWRGGSGWNGWEQKGSGSGA